MFKKVLAVALAATMAFTVAPVLPANTNVASAAAVAIKTATVGAEDKSTAFWKEFSDSWKIEKGKKLTLKFEHHSDYANAYDNFAGIFCNNPEEAKTPDSRSANYLEYAVVRADLWSWSSSTKTGTNTGAVDGSEAGAQVSLDGKTVTYTNDFSLDWTKFQSVMKDADVTLVIERVDNVAKMTVDAVSRTDNTQKINYTVTVSLGNVKDGDSTADSDVSFLLTTEKAYLKFASADISDVSGDVKIDQPQVGGEVVAKKTMSFMDASATTKKVTGELTVSGAKVAVKSGKTAAKSVTVKGKTFTATFAKALKPGAKVTITATKDGYNTVSKTVTAKGTMKLSKVKAKKGTKKVTGTLSVKKATVKVKVGKKKYKKATVKGKKFTFKTSKLKKGTTVKIKVTLKNYKTVTKTVKVK